MSCYTKFQRLLRWRIYGSNTKELKDYDILLGVEEGGCEPRAVADWASTLSASTEANKLRKCGVD